MICLNECDRRSEYSMNFFYVCCCYGSRNNKCNYFWKCMFCFSKLLENRSVLVSIQITVFKSVWIIENDEVKQCCHKFPTILKFPIILETSSHCQFDNARKPVKFRKFISLSSDRDQLNVRWTKRWCIHKIVGNSSLKQKNHQLTQFIELNCREEEFFLPMM